MYEDDLTRLATKHGTDKWGSHWYAKHYHRHFRHLRSQYIKLLEIGIGGYDIPQGGGGSLRMWREYFPGATIVGLDIYDKSPHQEPGRIVTVQGDQSSAEFLHEVNNSYGPFDIIVDDGSHINSHVIKSFEILFPLLKQDGIYAIEDTQTSYWRNLGGHAKEKNRLDTSMGFTKSLIDGLNYSEIPDPEYVADYAARNIVGMHFYHNLVVIDKGENNEGSAVVINNNPNANTG